MNALTQQEIDDLDDLISTTNHRSYENYPHGSTIEPHQIYLYYITNPYELPDPNPLLFIKDYGRPIHNDSVMKSLVKKMVHRICDPDDNYIHDSEGFNNKKWTMRTYIVIVIDSRGWKFREDAGIIFDPTDDKTPNHTFFDGFDFDVDVDIGPLSPRKASAAGFINYMAADEYGNPLARNEEQVFKFWLIPSNPAKSRSDPVDPGGTNLGPPVPPP